MFKDIPSNLNSGPVHLVFQKIVTPTEHPELVPFYHFKIIDSDDRVVGHINLRVGDTRHLNMYAGHIGYEVLSEYRGHSYSLYACRALLPFARRHYDELIVTAEIDNYASLKIIKKLGVRFIEEVEVPSDDPAYASGARRRKRFCWLL